MQKKTIRNIVFFILFVFIGYVLFAYFDKPDYTLPAAQKQVFGDANARVKIIEFSDLQCPACKASHPVVQQIKNDFGNNISFQYYHFPLRSIHPFAQKAAEASECANDQGKFWEYIDAAFIASPKLGVKELKRIAVEVGLDVNLFNACLDSSARRGIVEGDLQFGVRQNVAGTPTFFINGKKLGNWGYDSFAGAIKREAGLDLE